jgi:hypothetical protein
MIALVLRDAYRTRMSVSAKQVTVDMLIGAGGVLISQAIVALTVPQLAIPLRGYAGFAGFGLIYLLRLQSPTLGAVPNQAVARVPATLEALVTEVRLHERMGKRARLIEAVVGVAIALFFLRPLSTAPNVFLATGFALGSLSALYVAVIMLWNRSRPMPDGLGFGPSMEYYRQELIRQHKWVRTMWLWYFLPFVPGLTLVTIGATIEAAGRGRPLWGGAVMAAVLAGVFMAAYAGSRSMARKLQIRIDALGAARER